jgi:hypothetical protein
VDCITATFELRLDPSLRLNQRRQSKRTASARDRDSPRKRLVLQNSELATARDPAFALNGHPESAFPEVFRVGRGRIPGAAPMEYDDSITCPETSLRRILRERIPP